jgi:hypothetical protein
MYMKLRYTVGMHWLVGLGLALVCTGCATVTGGSRDQKVVVNSKPDGAQVYIDGQAVGVTPTEVTLSRKNDHEVVVDKPGYQPYRTHVTSGLNPWVFGNLAVGGVIGLAVDIGCDSCHQLRPSSVEPNLSLTSYQPPAAPLAN